MYEIASHGTLSSLGLETSQNSCQWNIENQAEKKNKKTLKMKSFIYMCETTMERCDGNVVYQEKGIY